MQNDKFKQAIFEALAHEYENSIKIKEKHIFSSKFEKKKPPIQRQVEIEIRIRNEIEIEIKHLTKTKC